MSNMSRPLFVSKPTFKWLVSCRRPCNQVLRRFDTNLGVDSPFFQPCQEAADFPERHITKKDLCKERFSILLEYVKNPMISLSCIL